MTAKNRDGRRKTRSRPWWSTPKKIGAVVLVVAAGISTLTGAAKDAYEAVNWWSSSREKPAKPPEPTQFERTPRLGLQFWQDRQMARMFSKGDSEIIRVKLKRAPFQLRVPARPDGRNDREVRIHAWGDASLFSAQGLFGPATGIADPEYASGTLYLSKQGHTYLGGNRLKPYGATQYQAYFSTTQKIVYRGYTSNPPAGFR